MHSDDVTPNRFMASRYGSGCGYLYVITKYNNHPYLCFSTLVSNDQVCEMSSQIVSVSVGIYIESSPLVFQKNEIVLDINVNTVADDLRSSATVLTLISNTISTTTYNIYQDLLWILNSFNINSAFSLQALVTQTEGMAGECAESCSNNSGNPFKGVKLFSLAASALNCSSFLSPNSCRVRSQLK
jgi:hypothetical protein